MMSFFLRCALFCFISLAASRFALAQPGSPFPPEIDQASRVNSPPGMNDPRRPDVPDPSALHTPKGQLLEQPAMNGDDIAIMYFQLTGRRVLTTAAAAATEFRIVQPGPLTNQDVIDVIESSLILEGYALMEVPGNPSQLRLVPASGGASNVRNVGAPVISDPARLPLTDEIVTYSMRMQYMKPEEAARYFQSVVGQFSPSGQITPVPSASLVVITENALLIRRLLSLKEQIDVPSSSVNTKFVDLVYADAEVLAGQLNELLNKQNPAASAVQRSAGETAVLPGLEQAAAQSPPSGPPSAGQNAPLQITAENRTNRIILFGRTSDILFAQRLIEKYDQPSSANNSLRRKLKYMPVAEFLPIAADAIGATLGEGGSGAGSAGGNNPNRNQPSSNRASQSGGGGDSTGGGRASVGGEDGTTAPESLLVGKTQLIADNISNSILVKGPPHHLEIVENLIGDLDQRSDQIAITALFGKHSATNTESFGLTLASLLNDTEGSVNLSGGLGFGDNSPSVIGPGSLDAFADIAGAISGLNLNGFSDNFGMFVRAVKTSTQLQEISRPTIFTTNNRSARISSGKRIAVPTGTFNNGTTTTGGISTNVEYRDVALELEVRPLVNGRDEVTVEISLVKDSIGSDRIIDNLTTTDIDSEELETIVTIADGSVVVLGGVYVDRDDDSGSRIPLLGDIPILGRLFRSQADEQNLDELVIMIYTKIIADRSELAAYQREYDRGSYTAPITRKGLRSNDLLEATHAEGWRRTESQLTPAQLDWLEAEVERQMPEGKPWIFYNADKHRAKLRKRLLETTRF